MKNIPLPPTIENENNGKSIFLFFFDMKPRMLDAVIKLCELFQIKSDVATASQPDSLVGRMIPGLVRQNRSDVRSEIDLWLKQLPFELAENQTVASFWNSDSCSRAFPCLARLARAILPAQASSAASERVWSSADDLCGGDRTNIDPENLNRALCLRKNTPVIAQILGVGLFDVLKGKKE